MRAAQTHGPAHVTKVPARFQSLRAIAIELGSSPLRISLVSARGPARVVSVRLLCYDVSARLQEAAHENPDPR